MSALKALEPFSRLALIGGGPSLREDRGHDDGMQPGERVNLIQSITTTLAQNDMSWEMIDVALDEFGADQMFGEVGSQPALHRVRTLPDDKLIALHAYLHPDEVPSEPLPRSDDGGPWQPDHFRLFISHASAHKEEAGRIRTWMARVGVDGFVAHTTIEPTREWIDVIEQALRTCHAMVAMFTKEFPTSPWCDQEVGVAVGRGILIVPVRMGIDPYGFIGRYQGLTPSRDGSLPVQTFRLAGGPRADADENGRSRRSAFRPQRFIRRHARSLAPSQGTVPRGLD